MAALLLRAGANLHTVDCNGDDLWAAVRREMGLRGAKQAGELLALLDKYAGTGDSGAEAERVRKQGALWRSALRVRACTGGRQGCTRVHSCCPAVA